MSSRLQTVESQLFEAQQQIMLLSCKTDGLEPDEVGVSDRKSDILWFFLKIYIYIYIYLSQAIGFRTAIAKMQTSAALLHHELNTIKISQTDLEEQLRAKTVQLRAAELEVLSLHGHLIETKHQLDFERQKSAELEVQVQDSRALRQRLRSGLLAANDELLGGGGDYDDYNSNYLLSPTSESSWSSDSKSLPMWSRMGRRGGYQ